ncbi:restriction endonuclease subunit S [Trichocoleus sp. ST-U3]|uniref:restriction endonuclease subunit S n=1 Tax=Coleofasciculus sp. FACHB-542 TaxID=2692787 RepID=UPI001688B6D4|nr:restriction endonuclease subunit S [Coleofasciculus sp. FACHB-542]MBD2083453.1 restriction endonuclease subunit S [Coleofasciculus sp. FACHB-542]
MPHPTFALEELGQIFQGIPLSRYQNDQGSPEPIVNVGDLEKLCLKNRDSLSQTQLKVPDLKRYQLHTNDVVIAIRGTLLKTSVVKDEVQGSVAGQNVAVFRPKLNKVNPFYVAVLMRSKWLEQSLNILQRQSTTTLPAIRVSQLRTIEIPLPDLPTQNQIAQLFLLAERDAEIIREELETQKKIVEFTLFKILEK